MKIGIIVGSIRDGRLGEAVGNWVAETAAQRSDADYELIDLKEFDVPLLTAETLAAMAGKQYDDDRITRWSQAIDSCDAYVFVTGEYNHGVPGAFKNAFDALGPEWMGKAIGFVGYGADGAVRAVEQWRQIVAIFDMVDVRAQVSLGLFTDVGESGLTPLDHREGELAGVFDAVVAKAMLLATAQTPA